MQALGDSEKLLISPSKGPKPKPTRTEERDEMFVLPPLADAKIKNEFKTELDEDDEEFCPKRAYDVNINRIDVNSVHFKSLPADIRHDILTDIKETRKQNTWAGLRELPVESNDFSSYQMSRLLRRRQVQVGLNEAEKEMGGKTWSLSELESLLKEDGVLTVSDKCAQKIASDENTRFLLVRDIAKAMEVAKEEISEPKPSTSTAGTSTFMMNDDDDDLELQRAIQMSLGNAVEEKEEEYNSRVKMNPEQRQKFAGTVHKHGLVRGFMMEYADMNGDDIQDLIEATQIEPEEGLNDSFGEKFPNTDKYVLNGTPKKSQKVGELSEIGEISGSGSENEVEEVKNKSFVIEIAPKDFRPEDDLFADVFKTSIKNSDDIPDVEVASISSDDDTLPYEIPKSDFEDVVRETESGFVSEEGKILEKSTNLTDEIPVESENDKFWAILNDPVKILQKIPQDFKENEDKKSENEDEKSENEDEKSEIENEKSENEDKKSKKSEDKKSENKEKLMESEKLEKENGKLVNENEVGNSKNEKFVNQKLETSQNEESEVGKSENEKFWGDEVVMIPDDDELDSNYPENYSKTKAPTEIPEDSVIISSEIIKHISKTPTKPRETGEIAGRRISSLVSDSLSLLLLLVLVLSSPPPFVLFSNSPSSDFFVSIPLGIRKDV